MHTGRPLLIHLQTKTYTIGSGIIVEVKAGNYFILKIEVAMKLYQLKCERCGNTHDVLLKTDTNMAFLNITKIRMTSTEMLTWNGESLRSPQP